MGKERRFELEKQNPFYGVVVYVDMQLLTSPDIRKLRASIHQVIFGFDTLPLLLGRRPRMCSAGDIQS